MIGGKTGEGEENDQDESKKRLDTPNAAQLIVRLRMRVHGRV